jgi:hypothetical protein
MPIQKVTSGIIADGAISVTDIADGAITGPKLGATSINANNIVNATITGTKLTANTVTGDKITVGSLAGNVFAANTVTGDKIGQNAISSNNIISSVTLTTPTISGNLNLDTAGTTGIRAPSANTSAFHTAGIERMRLDSSGNLSFNSGYGSVATAYGCRAWVNFNGTGTVAIRASGNVSSITDNGTGNYTINFTTAMPDANYCTVMTGQYDVNGSSDGNSPQVGIAREDPQPSTTSIKTRWTDRGSGIAVIDPSICNAAIFR